MKNYELLNYYKDLYTVRHKLAVLDGLIKVHLPKLHAHFVKFQLKICLS